MKPLFTYKGVEYYAGDTVILKHPHDLNKQYTPTEYDPETETWPAELVEYEYPQRVLNDKDFVLFKYNTKLMGEQQADWLAKRIIGHAKLNKLTISNKLIQMHGAK